MFKKVVFLLFAVAICNVFAVDSSENRSDIDIDSKLRDDYTEKFERSIYKYHGSPRTFAQAQIACQAEGAHLAIVNSFNEANFLVNVMNRNPALGDVQYKSYILVGFHNAFEKSAYFTIDGKTLERSGYTTFGVYKPTDEGRCGALYVDATLSNFPCDVRSPFICEYEKNTDSLQGRSNYVRVTESAEHKH